MTEKTVQDFLSKTIRTDIQKMSAYSVQDASGLVKLDAMENPYSWPGSTPGWPEILNNIDINRYPDPKASAVVQALREAMSIPDCYNIVLGNGSDELIQLLIQSVAGEKALVLSPEPSFVMYKVLAETNRVNYQGITLNEDFQLNITAMLKAIEQHSPQLLFLACPNNPTGVRYHEQDIRTLIEASDGLVIIDEAYIAFSDSDALPLLDDYPNLLIMRTLSKMGLAGLRMGLLIGHPAWINEVDKIRLPYNINVLTQVAAVFALQHYPNLLNQAAQIRTAREQLMAELQKLPTVRLWPSEANFILFKTKPDQARPIFEALKQQGILIKCMDGSHPMVKDCLRVTVGSTEENQQFLDTLKPLL